MCGCCASLMEAWMRRSLDSVRAIRATAKFLDAKCRDTASPIPGPTPTTARTGLLVGLRDMFCVAGAWWW